jgi:hypothetical protein
MWKVAASCIFLEAEGTELPHMLAGNDLTLATAACRRSQLDMVVRIVRIISYIHDVYMTNYRLNHSYTE